MSFWQGFCKKAESNAAGGGFSSVGKAVPYSGDGPKGVVGSAGSDDTKVDKTLLDRQRNPGDFRFGEDAPVGPADANQHLIY